MQEKASVQIAIKQNSSIFLLPVPDYSDDKPNTSRENGDQIQQMASAQQMLISKRIKT